MCVCMYVCACTYMCVCVCMHEHAHVCTSHSSKLCTRSLGGFPGGRGEREREREREKEGGGVITNQGKETCEIPTRKEQDDFVQKKRKQYKISPNAHTN